MKALLVDADSHNGFPNLALMKLSAHHKNQGDHVDLIKGIPDTAPLEEYDTGYISCIFFQNAEKVRKYYRQLPFPAMVGGSGWDHKTLDKKIEHVLPDYSLYNLDYSMGFTSRGCIRKCPFCEVPNKEGYIRDNAPISEFLHPEHNKVVLLDNNFLASPNWEENLYFLIDRKLKVNFNQGLDIRLVTEENAQILTEVKYYNWTFKVRGLHFAFDSPKHVRAVENGIEILYNSGIPMHHLMFYVLTGFDTTHEEDLERVQMLKDYGVKPYIMVYNQKKDSWLKHFARWINGRWHEFIPFEKYNDGALVEVEA